VAGQEANVTTARHPGSWLLAGVLLVASVGSATPAAAARKHADDDGDRPYWRTNLFKRVATDQKFFFTRWWPQEIKDPTFTGPLAAGLAIALQSGTHANRGQDAEWEAELSGDSGAGVKTVSHVFTELGTGVVGAAFLGITYLSARRGHDDRLAAASSLAAESLLNAGLWVTVLKTAAARARPADTNGGSFGQYGGSQNNSFPSGHAMGAFSVASVFAESYRDKKWVPWFSYSLATLIGVSRLTLGRHFPSDVIVGAVLGTSLGRGVVARNSEETPRPKGAIVPVGGPNGRGLGVAWSYRWK